MNPQLGLFHDPGSAAGPRQFRMRRLQVYNWGTFSGLHDIAIAPQGFLFVGRSGCGKTTLLDAIATLLTPPKWLTFNAAAREGERNRRDRNLVSYVRGAWGDRTDSTSGEIATHYLRRGTTWSALALTFDDGRGRRITLVHLYWIRGATTATTDVHRHYMIVERDFDLQQELSGFDVDLRQLKRRLAADDIHNFGNTFQPYGERLRRLLGIGSELALKLLHKTQSAKNLGDLNSFLREFMLDPPESFAAAERLVAEFAELDAAHQEVVTARRQVECLAPARREHTRLEELDQEIAANEGLLAAIDGCTELVRLGLLDEAVAAVETRSRALEAESRQLAERLQQARAHLLDLQTRHREAGGDRIQRLEAQAADLARRREERRKQRLRLEDACQTLGLALPEDPRVFSELIGRVRAELEVFDGRQETAEAERDDLRDRKKALEEEFAGLGREIRAMERQPSNIPARMLDLRQRIADAMGCAASELPFVGELLQVREEEAAWRGAIERLLHGFALSLLVDPARYPALCEYVNGTDLEGRLVYYRVRDQVGGAPDDGLSPQSLRHKLEIKETAFHDWLAAELARRFDYTCVDNLRDFRRMPRAITRQGQIRHGHQRHEKDDRHPIDDQRRWVLGFDNREKLAAFRRQAAEVGERLAEVERRLAAWRERQQEARSRHDACVRIANLEWADVDLAAILDRLAEVERQLDDLRRGNAVLQELGQEIDRQQRQMDELQERLNEKKAELKVAAKEKADLEAERDAARQRLAAAGASDADTQKQLEARLREGGVPTLKTLDGHRRRVERALHATLEAEREARAGAIRRMEQIFAAFKREWPQAAADMDATRESAPDFLRLLETIERDGLPRHEKRFFEMLREQSYQNLAALHQYLLQARREISLRLEQVNDGLAAAEFNPGTRLRIEVHDRLLPDVREFRAQVRNILEDALHLERQAAEHRFQFLKTLVGRLRGGTPEDRRWRDLVLDVRLHVEFVGRELDGEGNEVETYRSGAGKSGGQREKLATTCLAAALRYQLGGDEGGLPLYAPVVLDEAFGKADNEFTELAMKIFEGFGFQMIVATPLKSVMTLEPFIGGACFVDINDRRCSATLAIDYDEAEQRLRLSPEAHGQALPL